MLFVVFPLLLLISLLCVWSSLIWLLCVLDVSPWIYPVWDSLGFLDLGGYFLPHFREIFNYFNTWGDSSIFSWPFFLSSSSAMPMIRMLGCLTLSQGSLRLSSFLLILCYLVNMCLIWLMHVWGVLAVYGPQWVCPHSLRVCFPSLHCSGSRLLCRELSKVGLGLHALLRF